MRAVLLPGMDGTGELLDEFAAALAPEFDAVVVRYSRDTPLGYDELTAIVADMLPQEPFLLIAESFSGPIAMRIAAAQPAGLIGVVLCASFVRSPRPRLGRFLGLLSMLPLAQIPMPIVMPFLMGRWSTFYWARRVHVANRSVAPAVLRRRLREVATVNEAALVAQITCPVLYLKASQDQLVPPDSWRLIADHSRNAACIELEGPHFLLQAKPQECAATIKQ